MAGMKLTEEAYIVFKAEIDQVFQQINKLKKEYKKLQKAGVESNSKSKKSALEFNAVLELVKKGAHTLKKVWDKTAGAVINTSADFEILQTRLNALYGDVDVAFQKFQALKEAAKETPFRLKNIVEAQAQLKAFGFQGEKTIKMAADLAAFMGEDIVFAANSLGRAFAGGAGAADILRERGVLALVKLKAGVDDLKSISLPEFRKALVEAMEDPTLSIAGAAEKLMQTFRGAFSNLQDGMDILKNNLGQKILPFITKLIKEAEKAVRAAAKIFESQTSERIIEQQLNINAYITALKESNSTEDEKVEILKRLNPILARYLGITVDLETSASDLEEILNNLNKQFERQISIEIANEALSDYKDNVASSLKVLTKKRIELEKTKATYKLNSEEIEKHTKKIELLKEVYSKTGFQSLLDEASKLGLRNTLLQEENDKLLKKQERQTKKVSDVTKDYQFDLLELRVAQRAVNKELEKGGGLFNLLGEKIDEAGKLTATQLKDLQKELQKQFKFQIDSEEEMRKFKDYGLKEDLKNLIVLRDARKDIDLTSEEGQVAFIESLRDEYEILLLIDAIDEAIKEKAEKMAELDAEHKLKIQEEKEALLFKLANMDKEYELLKKLRSESLSLDLQTEEGQQKYKDNLVAITELLAKLGITLDKNKDKLSSTVDLTNMIADALYDSVTGAESLGDAVVKMFQDIANQLLKDLFLYLVGMTITGGQGDAFLSILGGLSPLGQSILGSSSQSSSFGKRAPTQGSNDGTLGKASGPPGDMTETNDLLKEMIREIKRSPIISEKQIGGAIVKLSKSYERSRA